MGRCWRFFLLIITYLTVFQPKKPDVSPFFFGVVTFLGTMTPSFTSSLFYILIQKWPFFIPNN